MTNLNRLLKNNIAVILNELKELSSVWKQDSSLRSE